MVEALHSLLREWVDECFPLRPIRHRSNEDPWITNGIRRKIRMCLRIFLREGRSRKWKKINKEIRKMIKAKKLEYVDSVVELGRAGDGRMKNGKTTEFN